METYTGDYMYNQTYTYSDSYEGGTMNVHAWSHCILYIIATIIYIFITSAIVFDRQRYQTTFWLALLNLSVTYILLSIIRYFGDVHIVVFPETNKLICHTVHFLNSIIGEGSEMVILPVCIDLIVKNMMSERYEKRKYRSFMLIMILVIWLIIIIKEIIHRKHTIIEFLCYQSTPSWMVWTELAFIILRMSITLVAVGFLLFIAKTSSQPASQLLGLVGAPILIGIFLCIVYILAAINRLFLYNLTNVALARSWLSVFSPIIIALVWLLDNNFRESVKKLLTCSPCRKMGPQPTEHELTTDIA